MSTSIYIHVLFVLGAPIFVYIHGGYWQHLSLEMSSFMAKTFCQAGAVVVAVGYELAPKGDYHSLHCRIYSKCIFGKLINLP